MSAAASPARVGMEWRYEMGDAMRHHGRWLASPSWRIAGAFACFLTVAGILAADEKYGRQDFDDAFRDHWAFQPIVRPEVPNVVVASRVRTPIDAFILARLEQEGIESAPAADARTFLRRASLDVVGLPPSVDEQSAFLADQAPDAYDRMVDRLLARPQFGERWARHWLDVVRYAESNGYERDGAKPNVWRYRDYVIDAFNADKPFDRFLTEQLAGDELPDANAETQIATTFLRLGPWDDEPADDLEDRYNQLDDVLDAAATSFLALSIRCARCHDHKFEPITQRDYTRMLAIFAPLKRPQEGRNELDCFVGKKAELDAYRESASRSDAAVADFQKRIGELRSTLVNRLQAEKKSSLPAEALTALTLPADKRDESQKQLAAKHGKKFEEEVQGVANDDERAKLTEWSQAMESAKTSRPAEPTRAYIWQEDAKSVPAMRVMKRGDPRAPAEEVNPGFPAILVDEPPPAATPTASTTGRRLQLAQWLTSPRHPLTARVIVNRIWQHYFGEGLVSTENDFGVMGDIPSHPELLDWLASELMVNGWRTKQIHRLILRSETYRLAAANTATGEAKDPQAKLLWRFRPRRLDAEIVRDSILVASGQLNMQKGGPSAFPKLSAAVLASQSRPGSGWETSPPEQAHRRSVYLFAKRTLPVPELEVLDLPNSNQCCDQRMVSTIAPQALTYWNGDFIHEQAKKFAGRLIQSGANDDERVAWGFEVAFARPPSEEERQSVAAFLGKRVEAQVANGKAEDAARQLAYESLAMVLLNSNEFVYVQ